MLLRFSLVLFLASLAFSQDTTDTATTPQRLYGGLVLPQVRPGTSSSSSSDAICGGTSRDKVHYMTTQGMDSEFRWYIETPTPDSVCQLRISSNIDPTDETGYVNLIPLGRTDVGADGFFPCGRASGVDSAFVDIPDQVDGDACVLEWIWKGADFTIRQCADISVVGPADAKCFGLCQNGGICQNGECVCPPGYSGTYCETAGGVVGRAAKQVLSTVFFLILIFLLIFLLLLLCYWCAQRKIKKGEESQVYNTNKKQYAQFDDEKNAQPADRIKADQNDIQNLPSQ